MERRPNEQPAGARSQAPSRHRADRILLASCVMALWFAISPAVARAQSADDLYKQASSAFDHGDFEQAVVLYQKVLQLQPDSVPIRTDLGVALAHLGRYAEAIENYQQALKRDPENAAVRLNLALAWYKQADFPKATSELELLHKKSPENRQVLYLLADCYLRLGRNDDVIALLRPEYEANPEDLAVDYAFGTALLREGKVREGEPVIDHIMKRGDTPEANLLLGEAQFAAQDYQAAATTLRKTVGQNPNFPEAWSLYGRALLNSKDEDVPGAKDAFERALQLDPNDFSSNLFLGSILRREGDYGKAMQYEEKALRLRPASPEVRFQIAAVHAATGKLEDSRKEFEDLEREYPNFLEVHVQLAAVYAKLHLPNESQRERNIVQKLNEKARGTELRPKL